MSPEKKRDFEAEWPLLSRRLRVFLGAKKVPYTQQDDLIQETALRLYKMWDSVDRTRPAWALTVTIALNLLRDEYRRAGHADIVAELPEIAQSYDLEQASLARIELKRVRTAMLEMSPEHRSVLLAEIGQHNDDSGCTGEKMRRMRARRKLTQLMERVSGVVLFPLRRLTDLGHGLAGMREAFAQSASCVLCGVLGVGAVLAMPAPAARSATRSSEVPPRVERVLSEAAEISHSRHETVLLDRAAKAQARARAQESAAKRRAERSGVASRKPGAPEPEPLVDPEDVTDRLPKGAVQPPPVPPTPKTPTPAPPTLPSPPSDEPIEPARVVREVAAVATKALTP